VARGLIEIWAWGLWLLYQFLAVILRQAFPDTATAGWLDLHCRQVGIIRKSATKAAGVIYFTRSGSSGNVPIPAGRIVRTKPDGNGAVYRYVTTAAAVLADGASEVAIAVLAEEYGAGANATAGQISEISTVIPGIDGVENRSGWLSSEGTAAEQDEPLRLRYQLAWKALNGCTKYAYQAWALEVPGTVAARILDQHPRGQGTGDVLIIGAAGLPTEQLLAAVRTNILGTGRNDEKNPINDDVEVRGPLPVAVAIAGNLELTSGDPEAIVALAENRLRALFAPVETIAGIRPLEIGQDLPLELQTWAVMGIPGVKLATWSNAPAGVADGELAVLDSLALTWSWASEE
jgi:uncharacterized phage protein gp47/JayE